MTSGRRTAEGERDVSNVDHVLDAAADITGALAVALVDRTSGMTLGSRGGGRVFDLDVAASGNSDVVATKIDVVERLGIEEEIEDILITLDTQYHLIRLIHGIPGESLFLYLVLDRARATLATARHELRLIEQQLFLSRPSAVVVSDAPTPPGAVHYYGSDGA